MAQQDTLKNRERFQAALQDAAAKQAIPLDRLSWRDIPNRDASDLIVEAGGKKRVFTITTSDMVDDAQGQIDQILNVAIDVE
jgi:predicted nuclease of predicted toxin-antitoxin system